MARALVWLALLGACGTEYTLTGGSPDAAVPPPGTASPSAPSVSTPAAAPQRRPPALRPVSVDDDGGSAVAASEDPIRRIRRETFSVGQEATTPLADFLFVVDNSESMRSIVDQVDAAFADLADDGVFPAEARVAVMSTIPGDLRGARRPHPATWFTDEIAGDPGFLRLVDDRGIASARQIGPDYAEAFAADGCAAWFTPTATNADGIPCMVAHTQSRLRATRVEAGLTAFAQLLERSHQPLFRPGAAVHVIFVSDTHDPGLPAHVPGFDALVEARPDFAALEALVAAQVPTSAFRVHAIAPSSDCGEEWAHIGPAYHDVAAASGGRSLDVCTTTDFRPLIRAIAAESGRMERPLLTLARPTNGDVRVSIDGVDVPFHVLGNRVISLEEADARRADRAVVTYRYGGAPRARPQTPRPLAP